MAVVFLGSVSFFLISLCFFFSVVFVSGFLVDVCLFTFFSYEFSFCFLVDLYSSFFFFVVCVISFVVYVFSYMYMGGTSNLRRFFFVLSIFVFSMSVLVFSGNFFCFLIGWDGLGVSSFLLVIFYDSGYVLDSGMVTFLVNRLGDSLMILSGVLVLSFGSWMVDCFFFSSLVGFFFFVGCITKSAQVPFSPWLPAAMSAPTPVSSLVHSSTLVTAGVYLLFRFSFFSLNFFASVVSLMTLFLGSLGACLEKDFKKVIAMSTLSHLGFMVYGLSLGFVMLSYAHMVFHAFFKAMLFLSCGMLIHCSGGGQDSRFYGGYFLGGFSSLFFYMSSLSLVGFPFFIGFFSKDHMIISVGSSLSFFFFFVFVCSCSFTVYYTFRMLNLAFFFYFRGVSFGTFGEEKSFFAVIVLFFFCCCWGFYSFFVFFDFFYFFGFDYMWGLLLVGGGLIIFLSVVLWGLFFFSIGYLNPVIFFFSKFVNYFSFHEVDSSWFEVFSQSLFYSSFRFISFYDFFVVGLKVSLVSFFFLLFVFVI